MTYSSSTQIPSWAKKPENLVANNGIDSNCDIKKIIQFNCLNKFSEFECWPVKRLFRICDNKPAVEITESKFEQSDKGNNDKDNDQDNDQDLG